METRAPPSTSHTFFAQAIDPEGYSLNQLIGSYTQHAEGKAKKLKISPPNSENKKRQLTVIFNDEELPGILSYQSNPPTLSIGQRTFPLTSLHAERTPIGFLKKNYLIGFMVLIE